VLAGFAWMVGRLRVLLVQHGGASLKVPASSLWPMESDRNFLGFADRPVSIFTFLREITAKLAIST